MPASSEKQDIARKKNMGGTTQAQIARKLGLSRSTVAAALNPRSPVRLSEETRSLILNAAERMGYRPHRYAQIMRAGTSGLIGVFHFGGLSQVAAERVWHASHAIQKAGYQVWSNDASWTTGEVRAACEAMLDARVEGVIVAGLNDPLSVAELQVLQAARIPIVALSGNELPRTPHIRGDARAAFCGLVEHLAGLGRKRLLLLFSLTHRIQQGARIWAGVERMEGFRAGLKSARGREVRKFSGRCGIEGVVAGLEYVSDRFDPFCQARDAMLEIYPRLQPDAVLCANDDWAIGALSALRILGKSVPGDVAVTGFDNTSVGAYLEVPLTTVGQPSRLMAEHAAELLIRKIRGGRVPSTPVYFPCELIVRKSCGAGLACPS